MQRRLRVLDEKLDKPKKGASSICTRNLSEDSDDARKKEFKFLTGLNGSYQDSDTLRLLKGVYERDGLG